jgi:phosphoribosyl 1,2-cyclic phosphodiesterase
LLSGARFYIEGPSGSSFMDFLSLNFFGVGDGAADANRNHASFLYSFPNSSFVLDCGEALSRSFKASGSDFEKFDRILISHLHSDHIGGFFMFIQGLWLQRRTRPLTVHLPADAIKPIQQMLEAVYLFPEVLPFPLAFEPHRSGEPVRLNDIVITPFRTAHLDRTKERNSARHPGNYDAFCFLIHTNSLRIGHSADLDSPRDLAPLLQEPLDLLVCELAHFKPAELFAALQGRRIRKLALVHLSEDLWSTRDAVATLAKNMLSGVEIVIPVDNDTLRVEPLAGSSKSP